MRIMKKMRLALMFVALAAISAKSFAAMSLSDIRREARFLTDRMGHELGLSNRQFEDVYEINFDFFYQANEVLDDVVYGYDDAIDYYYYLLDVRNEDLMYVLRDNQYRKFVNRDYFYRPIYMVGNTWGMRIWKRYTDHNYFYFSIPVNFNTYRGAHDRIHFSLSYYADRYSHILFQGAFRLWGGGYQHHKQDGWVNIGKKKHASPSSRPWSNANNYSKSRRDLMEGFVNIPSRDANKRKVKANSEENRCTVVVSDTPSRTSKPGRNIPSDVNASNRKSNASDAVHNKNYTPKSSSTQKNSDTQKNSSNTHSVSRPSSINGSSATIGSRSQSSNDVSRSSTSRNNSSNISRNNSNHVNKSTNVNNNSSSSRNTISRSSTSGNSNTISRSSASSSSSSSSRSR